MENPGQAMVRYHNILDFLGEVAVEYQLFSAKEILGILEKELGVIERANSSRKRPPAPPTFGEYTMNFFSITSDKRPIRDYEEFERKMTAGKAGLYSFASRLLKLIGDRIQKVSSASIDESRRLRKEIMIAVSAAVITVDILRLEVFIFLSLYSIYYSPIARPPGIDVDILYEIFLMRVYDILKAVEIVCGNWDMKMFNKNLDLISTKLLSNIKQWDKYFEDYRKAAKNIIRVKTAIDAAEAVVALRNIFSGIGFKGGGPSASAGAMIVVGARQLKIYSNLGLALEWEKLIEKLILIGALSAHVVYSIKAAEAHGGTSAPVGRPAETSTSGNDEGQNLYESERIKAPKGLPEKDPQPATTVRSGDDLILQVRGKSWEKQILAKDRILQGFQQKQSWLQFPIADRQNFGHWVMNVMYPVITEIYRGVGLPYKGGRLSKPFLDKIRKETDRVLFIETYVPSSDNWFRVDLMEFRFKENLINIIDLTTTHQPLHFTKTGKYGSKIQQISGFNATAIEMHLIDGGKKIAEELNVMDAMLGNIIP